VTSFNNDYPIDNNIILIALMKHEDISSVVMNVKLVLFFAEVKDCNVTSSGQVNPSRTAK